MQANGTKLWLDEGAVHATKMLQKLMTVEEKRSLSAAEEKLKQVAASYCYLYAKMLEIGELESDQNQEIFPDEILH
tara:strand:+ start:169 stop:396 length:228 start_codon:yes stop_codon:yes gene_type:complete